MIFNKRDSSNLSSYISDLMSGLMIIFLFISISYMLEVSKSTIALQKEKDKAMKLAEQSLKEKNNIKNIAEEFEKIKYSIYDELAKEFGSNLKEWNADINKDTLSVSFKEPDTFFNLGEDELNENFKKILEDFFPRYIKILSSEKYRNTIEEIRIEGHTSSEWRKKDDKITSYFKNMELSQARTRSVLEYVMMLPKMRKYRDFLITKVTANGLSYSQRIIENGKENYNRSRRVEFRVRTTAERHIEQILLTSGEYSETN